MVAERCVWHRLFGVEPTETTVRQLFYVSHLARCLLCSSVEILTGFCAARPLSHQTAHYASSHSCNRWLETTNIPAHVVTRHPILT